MAVLKIQMNKILLILTLFWLSPVYAAWCSPPRYVDDYALSIDFKPSPHRYNYIKVHKHWIKTGHKVEDILIPPPAKTIKFNNGSSGYGSSRVVSSILVNNVSSVPCSGAPGASSNYSKCLQEYMSPIKAPANFSGQLAVVAKVRPGYCDSFKDVRHYVIKADFIDGKKLKETSYFKNGEVKNIENY